MEFAVVGGLLTGVLGVAGGLLVIWSAWRHPRLSGLLLWSLLCSLLLSSVFIHLMPGAVAVKLTLVGVLSPLLWVGLMFSCYWFEAAGRVLAAMVFVSAGCGLYLYLSDSALVVVGS